MSFGRDPFDTVRQAAGYVARILIHRHNPAEMPFQDPRHHELAINLRTAERLGLRVPERLIRYATCVLSPSEREV